jgi:8-oxo-dGTP pyrophosphatase MutT (NUDIX family)
MDVKIAWDGLDRALAAHVSADAKEARDVAFVRAFLREHPADAHLRSQLLGHLTGSGFVLDSTRAKVLLLHHGRLHRWLQPGGHGEGETDTLTIALREIEEETGLARADLSPLNGGRLLDVDVHPIPERPGGVGSAGDGRSPQGAAMVEPAHSHLDLRYGFVAREGVQPRVSHESRDLRWFPLDALPDDADESLRRAVRKLTAPGA